MATESSSGRLGGLSRMMGGHPADRDPLRPTDAVEEAADALWRTAIRRRVLMVCGVLILWTAAIEARLIFLQVVEHDALQARALNQQQRLRVLPAERGDIVDRNGDMLAYSVATDTVEADPGQIAEPGETAAALCEALRDCAAGEPAAIAEKLGRSAAFAWVRRRVSPDQARRVAALKLKGIFVRSQSSRYYPKLDLAAHVVGFAGLDHEGLGGIEATYDQVIRGREGRALLVTDARRNSLESRIERAPTAGATVELTIDLVLQHLVERELRAGIERHRAKGGTAIVMDPFTGEVLAMANYPTFNPNAFGLASADARRNRAIQDIYEPGSTFKIVTASAALEEGVLRLQDTIDTSPGTITFPGRKPIEDEHRYGVLSFEDVVVKSSNVGAIKAGLMVGAERMSRYVRRFGFGEALAPDFRGVSRGIVYDIASLNDSGLASVSMGYQIGVTPMQMAAAVSAIANGGLLYEPRIVRAMIQDGARVTVEPRLVRRAIAPETAAALTTIMEGVVERGTAKAARLDGYQAAGKTGTAAKLVGGRYSESDYNASFIGFLPSRQPKLAILVLIDTPRVGGYYGGLTAAPVFKRIAEAALRHLGVPRTINPPPAIIIAADQSPWPARMPQLIPAVSESGGVVLMPDLSGQAAREAVQILNRAGLFVRVSGSGVVVSQSPAAGTPLQRGGWSVLELRRTPSTPPASGGERR